MEIRSADSREVIGVSPGFGLIIVRIMASIAVKNLYSVQTAGMSRGTHTAERVCLKNNNTFTPEKLSNGLVVDQRCYPDLQDMMDACRAAGNDPLICSSYRTWEKQEQLFQNKVDRPTAQGLSPEEARTEAAKSVAVPGTSEHQLGLAVDIVAADNQNLDQSQETTAVQRWLMEHCWEYGFILRYPEGKSDVTGIIYEPWHYRYVGKEAAKEIYDRGICLEEYLDAPEG